MTIDISYIKETVGDVIAEGLKETARAHPVDPLDYFAKWLLHYRDVQDNCAKFGEEEKKLQTDKEEYLEGLRQEKAKIDAEEKLRREKEEAERLEQERRARELEEARSKDGEEEEEKEEKESTPDEDETESGYSGSYN
ncbi:DPY30 domain-containing protein 1 [Tritrichomonas foetus]|uniref:DPY30 domain-containing protein 1 n=1 Tax=Tritrichomonas foetus TaxID=1144522 RepID=A0A1J4KCZ7_9EUKA|nr:DPY30 domain-containing protein 1 [Tritrichomonas foetus]|eukprot:OHT09297.1 DPY30 domain-containing protein 1 [Tritrichomonas foetus]